MEYTEEEIQIIKDTAFSMGIWIAFQYARDEFEIDLTDSELAAQTAEELGF